jgi:hypothetical protein
MCDISLRFDPVGTAGRTEKLIELSGKLTWHPAPAQASKALIVHSAAAS